MNLRSLIRTGYRALSVANTLSVLATGNPKKIGKHFLRKQAVKRAGRIGVSYHRHNRWQS